MESTLLGGCFLFVVTKEFVLELFKGAMNIRCGWWVKILFLYEQFVYSHVQYFGNLRYYSSILTFVLLFTNADVNDII